MPRPRRFELALGLALVQSACADAPGSGVADAVVAPRRDAVPVAGDLGPSPGADAARGADTGLGPANDATGGAQATDGPVTGSSDAQAAGGSADTRVLADTGVPADARGPDAQAPDAMRADPCADAVDLNAAVAAAGFVEGDTGGAPAETLGTCGGAAGGEVYFTWTVGPDLAPVTFATDFPETLAATVLYVRAACDGPADLGCTRGSPAEPGARLRFVPPAPGVYFLVVDTGSVDGGGPFRLTAESDPELARGRAARRTGRSTPWPGTPRTRAARPIRSARKRPTPGGSTTCWATSTSGRATGCLDA